MQTGQEMFLVESQHLALFLSWLVEQLVGRANDKQQLHFRQLKLNIWH